MTRATVHKGPNGGTEYRLWTDDGTFRIVGKFIAWAHLTPEAQAQAETMEAAWLALQSAGEVAQMRDDISTGAAQPHETLGVIDCTPTWRGILPVLLLLITDVNAEGQAVARIELQRMADLADLYVAAHRATAQQEGK